MKRNQNEDVWGHGYAPINQTSEGPVKTRFCLSVIRFSVSEWPKGTKDKVSARDQHPKAAYILRRRPYKSCCVSWVESLKFKLCRVVRYTCTLRYIMVFRYFEVLGTLRKVGTSRYFEVL